MGPRGAALSSRLDRMSEARFALLAAAPGLLLVGLFVVPPVVAGVGLGFFRVELLRDGFTPFIGFRNYATRLPMDAEYLGTLPLTLAFAAAATALAVPIALATAVLINRHARLGGPLSLLLLLPWAVAPIAAGLFWKAMFDFHDGLVNHGLLALGLPRVALHEAAGTLVATLVAVVWRAVPLLGVLFLGALRQVPRDLERAARLDGASSLQAFRHVTLPAIAPSVIVACLLQIVLTLQVFDLQFALTADSPPRGSELAAFSIYQTVIGQISLGYGAAKTVVLGILIAACMAALYLLVLRPRHVAPAPLDEDEPAVARQASVRVPAQGLVEAEARPATRPSRPPGRRGSRAAMIRGGGVTLLRGLAIAALAVWLAGPVLWIVVASTQAEAGLIAWPPELSLALRLDGYEALLSSRDWWEAAIVSVSVTSLATLLALGVATLTAYPLARYRVPGGRWLLSFLLGSQLIPPIALAIPVLFLFIALGLRNTIVGLVLVNAAFWTPILVWLVRTAFLAVPRQLELAARIDGSSRLGAIFRVGLPAAAPAIAAAAAIVFVGIWNDFVFAAIIGGRDTYTLPRYLGESANPLVHVLAAKIVLTVAPCVVLVALFWRRILRLL